MAGRGPAPKPAARRRNRSDRPLRGEWHAVPGTGWQHGPAPAAPKALGAEARKAWTTWTGSWFAAHWTAGDLPGLTMVARLYDACARGELVRAGELRLWLDAYGISPSGRRAGAGWSPTRNARRRRPAPVRSATRT